MSSGRLNLPDQNGFERWLRRSRPLGAVNYDCSALLIAANADLRAQVQFLKAQNQVLRAKLPRRLQTTALERGRPGLKDLISIVTAKIFTRWVRESLKRKGRKLKRRRPGRPKTLLEVIRDIILRIARETDSDHLGVNNLERLIL